MLFQCRHHPLSATKHKVQLGEDVDQAAPRRGLSAKQADDTGLGQRTGRNTDIKHSAADGKWLPYSTYVFICFSFNLCSH